MSCSCTQKTPVLADVSSTSYPQLRGLGITISCDGRLIGITEVACTSSLSLLVHAKSNHNMSSISGPSDVYTPSSSPSASGQKKITMAQGTRLSLEGRWYFEAYNSLKIKKQAYISGRVGTSGNIGVAFGLRAPLGSSFSISPRMGLYGNVYSHQISPCLGWSLDVGA